MFYAVTTKPLTSTSVEVHALAFYDRADRANWLSANEGRAITAKEYARLKTAGSSYTVASPALGMVFFGRIVEWIAK